MIEFLKGKKTYILAIGAALTVLAYQLNYIDVTTANTILAYMLPAGLITLKAGQNRVEQAVADMQQ